MSKANTASELPAHLPAVPLLEHIRPPHGWRTDRAVVSTYSGRASVIVAAVLSLAGEVDEKGTGSRLSLARALTRLRGRAHFILQAGRLGLRRHLTPILGLLDRFLVQMDWNEGDQDQVRGRSWHPKFALSRQVNEHSEAVRWVFVLGSRNLTHDTSWDLCLALEGEISNDRQLHTVPGIDGLAERVAELAAELAPWHTLAAELSRVRWNVPAGLSVSQVRLMLPGDAGRGLPQAPAKTERILAVAPFLDGGCVSMLSAWAEDRVLLSTRPRLAAVAGLTSNPLKGWKLLELPEADLGVDGVADVDVAAADQSIDQQNRGLHAKFLFAEHRAGGTLWLGSPNLTRRGWTRNAEAFAEVQVTDPASPAARGLLAGILRLTEHCARTVEADELEGAEEPSAAEEIIESARCEVAARLGTARQRRVVDGTHIVCAPAPHPDTAAVELHVALLGGDLVRWPAGSTQCLIPRMADDVESNLVRIQLRYATLERDWVQVVLAEPALPADRDDRALRRYLGPRQLLAWIRETLTDVPDGDGGGPWDAPQPPRKSRRRPGGGAVGDLPSVESVLRAWMRKPERIDDVDSILRAHASAKFESDDPLEREAAAHLAQFVRTWDILRKGIPKKVGHGR